MWKLLVILIVQNAYASVVYGDPKVPCFFIFGDSLSDAGNNNDLNTSAKVNYPPYGVDFPEGPTGRFTNGRTIVDVLTGFLGMKGFIAPFSNATDQDLLKGVNYASGASGIRIETGSHLGEVIWMDHQLINHATVMTKLQTMVNGSVHDYLSKCLYTVNIGSNDYLLNYFVPKHYPSQSLYTPDQYAQALINQYRLQLQALYSYGARKVAVFGLARMGCIPSQIRRFNTSGCVSEINHAVQLFNQRLPPLIDYFNNILPDAKFTFIDMHAMQSVIPPLLPVVNITCCELKSDFMCKPNVKPCSNRFWHAFMDGYHPMETLTVLCATIAFVSPAPLFVHPMDINQLISA